jgi:NAD+ synthase (glutamine-hydrolysing)
VVYVNVVGGQDDVVFDGDSMLCAPDGSIVARGAQFAEDLMVVDLPVEADVVTGGADLPGHTGVRPPLDAPPLPAPLAPEAEVWDALVLATRDYVRRNGFTEVIVALSGGIDSAVVGAIAADALGGDHVLGLLLPSPWSSDHSLSDARALANALGIRTHLVPIAPAMDAYDQMLADVFAAEGTTRADDGQVSLTEENIQSRIRGNTLMALSNKFGYLVLTTGNKSELAVGYATLYGDMGGGLAVIGDLPKTMVYELAHYINRESEIIPHASITKPPSAELRPNQTDQDTLPPYEILDAILQLYVDEGLSCEEIVARGFNAETVVWVLRTVDRSEYKRWQAAPVLKVTSKAFGTGRRIPIAAGYRAW